MLGRALVGRALVAEVDGQEVGAIVDAVTEVMRIPINTIDDPSSYMTGDSDCFLGIAKLEGRLVVLLDIVWVLTLENDISGQEISTVTASVAAAEAAEATEEPEEPEEAPADGE